MHTNATTPGPRSLPVHPGPGPRAASALCRVRALALLVALAGCALAGCAATQRKTEPLADSVRTYNEAVRWLRFEEAATRLPANRRDDFLDERDQLHEDLRITDYEIIRVRHDAKGRRAKVQIKYTWYLDSRGKVHETHAVQTWHQGEEIWILKGERFLRGEPMPGLEGDKPTTDTPVSSGTPGETPDAPTETSGHARPEIDPEYPETDPAPPEEAADDPPQGS